MSTHPHRSAGRARLLRLLGVTSIIASLALGAGATSASAANPGAFSQATGGLNTYDNKTSLSANCPEGIAGTPGSDPADKKIVSGTFTAGGTINYVYQDNPNDDSKNFNLEDCVVKYPASKFSASDFNASGQLVNAFSKADLTKDATELDKATLSGVTRSTGEIFYSWTAPGTLNAGEWVCNFARDTSTGHGGGGNRKVNPTCYQVQGTTPPGDVTLTTSTACGVLDFYTIPTTANVTYKNGTTVLAAGNYDLAEGQSVTITAHTQAPYFFDPAAQTSWPFTGGVVETGACTADPVRPATPSQNTPCGVDNTYTITGATGVEYFVNDATTPTAPGTYPLPEGTSVKIEAKPAPGRQFAQDVTTKVWNFTGAAVVPCAITPAAPTYTVNTACGVLDTYTIPTQAGVQYKVNGTDAGPGTSNVAAGQVITITAEPIAPNTFTQGAVTTWGPNTGSAVETCGGGGGGGSTTELEETNTTSPRVSRECGEVDEYVIPNRDGVIYSVDGEVVDAGRYELPEGERVEITAAPAPGFTIPADEDVSWTFTGQAVEECPTEPEPEEPIEPFTPEPSPAQVETPPAAPAPAAPVLAFTGLETRTMLMTAITLLGIGLALVVASKRELRVK